MADYTLRRILTTFQSKGAPELDAVVSITPASAPRQVQPTPAELAKLLACPDPALRSVILACAEAGMRSGTAIRITPGDVIDGRIVTRSRKGYMRQTSKDSQTAWTSKRPASTTSP